MKGSHSTSQLPLTCEVDKGKVWKPMSISSLPFPEKKNKANTGEKLDHSPKLVLGQSRLHSSHTQSMPFPQTTLPTKMAQEDVCLNRELETHVTRDP